MSEALAIRDDQQIDRRSELTVEELVGQVQLIQQAMKVAMRDGEHFGVIPGTDKPTLLKPGAEKLCLLFRLDPEYESTEKWDGDHYTVTAMCRLFHIPTGNRVASGQGMCSTKESKYAWRTAQQTCPECGAATIYRSKHKPEFYCWKKKGGCGATFPLDDGRISSQQTGRVANENLPDTYNTVLKMACKRALVAAVLNGTAASDIFTQDLDDSDERLSEPDTGTGTGSAAAQESGTSAGVPSGSESRSSDERKESIAELDQAFKHVADHGSLPPGHDDWGGYLRWFIEGKFQIDPAQWRTALTPEQIRETASYLRELEIPL